MAPPKKKPEAAGAAKKPPAKKKAEAEPCVHLKGESLTLSVPGGKHSICARVMESLAGVWVQGSSRGETGPNTIGLISMDGVPVYICLYPSETTPGSDAAPLAVFIDPNGDPIVQINDGGNVRHVRVMDLVKLADTHGFLTQDSGEAKHPTLTCPAIPEAKD